MAQLLDGKACAKAARARMRSEIAQLLPLVGYPPHVVFVQVGEIPASSSYVNAKSEAARKVGMRSTITRLPESISQDALLTQLARLNADTSVHGVLVQLPLPEHIDPLAVALAIAPEKDIDCFNPANVGKLTIGLPGPRPATPQGILMLLDHYGIDVAGMQTVVIGRSNLVGKPMGLMLLARNATVTWCHSATSDLAQHTRRADLIVSAAGDAQLLRGEMVKPGVVVVDVGTNYVPENDTDEVILIRGQRDEREGVDPDEVRQQLKLVGDVMFDEVEPLASWISPVPGGVGPMTIASVLWNGLMQYKLAVDRGKIQ
ncbi:MAG: bifunctional 5,10-methylene-tetrahydrofolate dehydrogenase/5,10-methylene-tetrahydrofolate cyclohydrolase [bacterium]|nr:bifunctional 5,10-methylene-tetrahydrofolate dehydrogenase/5,10-methylene-tetrahydrofolate cyclohydrolase [bacterium]